MWLYEGKEFTSDMIDNHVGFVYEIESKIDGRKYIGKKLFSFKKILRRKKKNVRVNTESDWQSYWGSNGYLCEDVQNFGEDKFTRKILMLCKSKTELGYYELKFQMERDVLLKPDEYYNAFIGYKAHRKNLIKEKK